MSSGTSNQSPASVTHRNPPLTFLTIPPETQYAVYDFSGFFEAEQVKTPFACLREYFGAQIMYNGRQTYEEVQRRFYNSMSFFVNVELQDFVDKIGARNARATRKHSVLWPIWKFDFKTGFDVLRSLGCPARRKCDASAQWPVISYIRGQLSTT